MVKPYCYEQLPDLEQHIRLLTLYPGQFESEICLSLACVYLDIDRPLDYDALSYTWGELTKLKPVTIRKDEALFTLPVTYNLWTALRYLRDTTQIRTLWIDAVCINQAVIDERNAQVARMADIYRSASKVIIWLGPAAHNSEVAMETLSAIASKISIKWRTHTMELAHPEDTDPDLLSFEKELKLDYEIWKSLDHLLNRAWFRRLWIWQEVFLAQGRAHLVCGNTSMPWDCFRKAVFLLVEKRMPSSLPGILSAITRAWSICSLRDQLSITTVLKTTTNAQCSDQRDRVYGILELIEKSSRPNIQPDYTKTTVDVFRDLMLTMAIFHQDLSLLTLCKTLDLPTHMPSWVPNLSKPVGITEMLIPRACWNSSSHARTSSGGPLTVCGCWAATVTQTVDIFGPDDPYPPSYTRMYAALRSLLCLLREKLLGDFDRQMELICHTLCRNGFSDCYEPKSENLVDCRQTIEFFIKCVNSSEETFDGLLAPYTPILDLFYAGVADRGFVFATEGYFGLAPKAARPNDIIVALLGLQSSMMLRPTERGEFVVVGESYVHEIMTGDLFLGPLSKDWQRVWRYDEKTQGYWDAFIDREKGIWQIEDPRLGPLPDDWVKDDHPMQHVYHMFCNKSAGLRTEVDPRMSPEALRARGVDIRDFDLV